jgi:DNA processing protein
MQQETALRWSWMDVLTRKRLDALVEKFGDAEKALDAVSLELFRALGVKEESALRAMVRLEEFDADEYIKMLKKKDLRLLTIDDADYPLLLLQIPDAPVFLYVRGDLSILNQPCVAIVGSREMSDYGKRVVSHLVPPIIRSGAVTVSGLAYGIDAEVAKETLHAGGKTVAVLGHGLGMIYPKLNEKLAEEIVKKGGLLVSEYPLDAMPDTYTFPARNRIIAGLSLCTVVAEAAEDSGSLITADLALDYGRDVCAVAGSIFDPNYAGCHKILSRGVAKLVMSGEDVLQELGLIAPQVQRSMFLAESPEEQGVFDALTSLPVPLDDIVVKTKLDAATVNAVLTILELKGAVKNTGGGQWVHA